MSETVTGNLEHGVWRTLGKRWTLPILKSMGSKEALRFSEIKNAIAGISSTMLSERLMELESEGLVAKKIRGSKVEYSQAACARELGVMLTELERWWSAHRRPTIANYQ
jgi:DNA-binding HxlR family transcriptional regulator